MRAIRKILAATAVTGATAVSLLAGAAPASADAAGANAFGWYTGYGSGSSASFAIWSAENDAKWKAQLGGFNTFLDCRTTSSYSTKISDYYYTANVQLYCYNLN
ncbi:hypothetical protein GA0070216_105288 [Micromonospora matsumotoense]|uniref:Bacteriocin (Lactococcin_972) n=1 Tax=Micromonospora matsumotoense TaxID=121616 RepID=A0A1C4Y045_9ACTN|nr:hypothetical protein [Micromonospora matsumotoense]SCF14078.1 hypothetical protein GA0070216_105288 [Micromonospora matsumotoense]